MTKDEYREKVREALVDGLLSFNGATYNEETKQAMLDRMIEVWPKRDPIQWVESATIESGVLNVKLSQEAIGLLGEQGWEEAKDAPLTRAD